ncbi:uncharacterized protein LOC108087344 [Drosophila ficusphila]|uniref:uncharacterized protein LOC108087344 n=1 Tax=Drosophila ficusphila TaxID=30025 RepID=UPI001C890574|nr:uncharacterized protein LOC108087344 [Drosophila ficusphila]
MAINQRWIRLQRKNPRVPSPPKIESAKSFLKIKQLLDRDKANKAEKADKAEAAKEVAAPPAEPLEPQDEEPQDEKPKEGEKPKEDVQRESVESYQSLASENEESDDEEIKAILNQKVELPSLAESPAEEDEEYAESVSSGETPLPRLGQSVKGEFIREFESLPSIADISLDVEPEPEPETEAVAQKTSLTAPDTGHFVEGGGGGGSEGSGEGESSSERDASTAALTVADGEEQESDSVIMEDLLEEPGAQEKTVVIGEEMDTMAMFAVAAEADVEATPEVELPVEEPFWYRLTADFLNQLISSVVANVENTDKNKELLLDKRKMMVGLQRLVDEYQLERYMNSQLNNVVCDYFRRIRKNNNFQVLPPEDARQEYVRFLNAINVVDNLMERQKMIKIKYGHSASKAMLELNSLTVLSYNEEQRLEGFMRKTLIRRDMDRLKRALEYDLRRMQDLRNQVSEKRYELNLNLHNLAFIDEKVMKFERVTDTLTISQMLWANESIIQLGKQLEEKCKDVAVMQSNYKKSMIEETCIREKRDMIAYMLSKAKAEYTDRFIRRNNLRKELTRLQLEHAELKAKRAKLESKGGLLFKVGLMYDYDKCMADIEARRNNIRAMKKTCFELSKRIYNLENESRASSISVRHFD